MNKHQTHRNSSDPAGMPPSPEPVATLWQSLALEPNALDAEQQAWLQEAVTHTSSGLNPHHEQLEFLGMRCCDSRPANSLPPPTPRCLW